eukprot:3491100-Amphidinium_carterae.2
MIWFPSVSGWKSSGDSPASNAACTRLRASSTAKASTPSSTPGVSSRLGGAPLTSSISSSGVSTTAGSSPGSCARRSASRPCSGTGGLPRPGLGVRGASLCPVAWTGEPALLLSRWEATGPPGASALAAAFLIWSTFSASALACGS